MKGSHGVMVSTLDFESSDPSSNLGGTLIFIFYLLGSKKLFVIFHKVLNELKNDPVFT